MNFSYSREKILAVVGMMILVTVCGVVSVARAELGASQHPGRPVL